MATVILTNTWGRERLLASLLVGGSDFLIDHLCKIHWLQLEYHSTATVGDRLIKVSILDADGNVMWDEIAGAVQPASKDYLYNLSPVAIRNTVEVEGQLDIPMPEITIPNKQNADTPLIRVQDLNNVDSGDTYRWIGEFSDL